MKSLYLIPALALLASCGNSQKDLVLQEVKNNLKDPNSFELIKYEPRDTVFMTDTIQRKIEVFQEFLSHEQTQVDWYNTLLRGGSDKYWLERLNETKDKVSEYQSELDKRQTLYDQIKGTDRDSIVCFKHYVSCYGANSFGARVMNEFSVSVFRDQSVMIRSL
jgi:hypothetical protein